MNTLNPEIRDLVFSLDKAVKEETSKDKKTMITEGNFISIIFPSI